MRSTLFLLVNAAIVGSLLAQYPSPTLGCTRHVTLPSTTYAVPTYQPQCQCQCYQPQQCPRMNIVPYNYCQPPILQQNIVPPPCPVYQSAPLVIPIPCPAQPTNCCESTVQQQSHEPGHKHPRPEPKPRPYPSIPGLSDADAKRLVPNLGQPGHNHPVVVQSVIVGKKNKEKEEEGEKEKGKKDKDKGECPKKRRSKKKCSEEVEDDDDEERVCRRKKRRRCRKRRPTYDPDHWDEDHYHDHYDPWNHWGERDPLESFCSRCNINNNNNNRDPFIYLSQM